MRDKPSIVLTATPMSDGKIVLERSFEDELGRKVRRIMETEDELVRKSLISLGWTPPQEQTSPDDPAPTLQRLIDTHGREQVQALLDGKSVIVPREAKVTDHSDAGDPLAAAHGPYSIQYAVNTTPDGDISQLYADVFNSTITPVQREFSIAVKWDGCTDIWFNGNRYHFDYDESFDDLVECIKFIRGELFIQNTNMLAARPGVER